MEDVEKIVKGMERQTEQEKKNFLSMHCFLKKRLLT